MEILDAGTKAWSGLPPRGMEYWQRLDDVIQREPVEPRDIFFHAMLRPLGLAKGKPFTPDARQTKILTDAALVGEAMAKANSADRRFAGAKYRSDAHWDYALQLDADDPGAFWNLLDERASWFYEAFGAGPGMAPKRPGPSSAYLGAYKDKTGKWLDGGTSYRLRVPPNPPIKLFWSVTVYDVDTRALIVNDAEDCRSLVAHGPAQERGRLGGHLLRPDGAGRLREELDPDRPRQELVRVFPVLPADRGVLRSVLAVAGLRAGIDRPNAMVTGAATTRASTRRRQSHQTPSPDTPCSYLSPARTSASGRGLPLRIGLAEFNERPFVDVDKPIKLVITQFPSHHAGICFERKT